MTTSISLFIDDDVKFREEYALNIENATEEQVILGILRVVESALTTRKSKLEEFMRLGFQAAKAFNEAMSENSSSDPVSGKTPEAS